MFFSPSSSLLPSMANTTTKDNNLRSRASAAAANNGDSKAKVDGKSNSGITDHGRLIDQQLDSHEDWEFGGPIGVTAMMIGFPLLMYYLYICLSHFQGEMVHPRALTGPEGIVAWGRKMWEIVKTVSGGCFRTSFGFPSLPEAFVCFSTMNSFATFHSPLFLL